MKVILNQDIKNLGSKGEIFDVSRGYARNYLIPRNLVVIADVNSIKKLENNKKKEANKLEKVKESYREVAEKLHNLSVEVKADVGEGGKLFGSVTSQDIVSAVKELIGIDLDRKQIMLAEPIKAAGKKNVEVRFASDIKATLSVLVSPKQ